MQRLLIHALAIALFFFGAQFVLYQMFPELARWLGVPNAAGKSLLNMICGLSAFLIWIPFNKLYPLDKIGSGPE